VYSKNAMPQLANMATHNGAEDRFFKCPYHAKVMKTFEHTSSRTVQNTLIMTP